MEQLALGVEGHFACRRAPVLEQVARADELEELVADVGIRAAHVIDVEASIRAFVTEHEGSRRNPRNGVGDIVIGEPVRPEKSCSCHRSRRSSTRREWNNAHTEL